MGIDVSQFRKLNERKWEVPLLETDLPAGVMPLFVNKNDVLTHIGTAFLISAAGVIATAAHCIMQALKAHGYEEDEFDAGEEYDFLQTKVKLSVLHLHRDGSKVNFSFWSVANVQIAHPSDIAFGCLHNLGAPMARAIPHLTFRVPAPDSHVQVVGYPGGHIPTIEMAKIHAKTFDWNTYRPSFLTSTGQVRGIILQRYEPVTKGACVVTDCPVIHGMSGGPVITQNGVCGVVTANTNLADGSEGSALSLFYPALPISLNLIWMLGPNVKIECKQPLIETVEKGLIKSDGTQRMHRIVKDGELFRVDPRIEQVHLNRVYDNRRDFCEGRPSTPLAQEDPPTARE